MSPWLLRIEMARDMMVDKKLLLSEVAERINSEFEDDMHCLFNDDNADKLILRIRWVQWVVQGATGWAGKQVDGGGLGMLASRAADACQSVNPDLILPSALSLPFFLLPRRVMMDEPGGKGGGETGEGAADDVFLKKVETSMLSQVKLQGIEGIRKVGGWVGEDEGLPARNCAIGTG
jgi:hypothetical protein